MPSVTLTFDVANGNRLLAATNYDAGSGLTEEEWIKDFLTKHIKAHVLRYEQRIEVSDLVVT